jgi:hypothetical protein
MSIPVMFMNVVLVVWCAIPGPSSDDDVPAMHVQHGPDAIVSIIENFQPNID